MSTLHTRSPQPIVWNFVRMCIKERKQFHFQVPVTGTEGHLILKGTSFNSHIEWNGDCVRWLLIYQIQNVNCQNVAKSKLDPMWQEGTQWFGAFLCPWRAYTILKYGLFIASAIVWHKRRNVDEWNLFITVRLFLSRKKLASDLHMQGLILGCCQKKSAQ